MTEGEFQAHLAAIASNRRDRVSRYEDAIHSGFPPFLATEWAWDCLVAACTLPGRTEVLMNPENGREVAMATLQDPQQSSYKLREWLRGWRDHP